MKYIKWIEVGTYYIVQKIVNSEQIRFEVGRVEAEERPLSQTHTLICPYIGESSGWMLFGVGLAHTSDFGRSGGDTTNS